MKKISLVFFISILMLLAACGGNNDNGGTSGGNKNSDILVGISMPEKTLQRWVDDGNNMVEQFKELGYKTDIQYAENDVDKQVEQIENMEIGRASCRERV